MRTFKTVVRWILTVAMVAIGVLHFVRPGDFAAMIPRQLPAPYALTYISGVAEILGGLGLILERTRRLAGWGLILLYIAVFPANINMAVNQASLPSTAGIPPLALWLRLPFQLLFIAIAWWFTRPDCPAAATETRRTA